MPRHDFKKNSGSLIAGFLYQNLVAIEILIDFYKDRSLYEWVQLEAEDPEFKSIEDVVACRPDGRYELMQVKFTVDPDAPANRLSWDWLTEIKRKKGTSLLQKWASTTLLHKDADTLAWAVLKTDRVPDAAFCKCLKNGKVDTSMMPVEVRTKVEEQIGSYEEVEAFFESFEFVHSQPRIDDLENELWRRVSSDTDRGGWALFLQQVQQWSMRKKRPDPDGRIMHIHLRQAFSIERPRPIPQDFRVPKTYCLPDEKFDKAFLKEITDSDGLTVLWGPPGRGKSTYISHCLARINQENAVCIRHHYFLSLTDTSEERFYYNVIARSLEHQLEGVIPELEESCDSLGEFLEKAAGRLQSEGRRLIVVIDGLDHVWREHRKHEEVERVFNALLPLPPNVRLVVGTQKIDSEHLPTRLLNSLPTERWTELPLMSQSAVNRWLRLQDQAGRLNLRVAEWQERDLQFQAAARAFHDISHGLPLHLIYSFEEIARSGNPVTAADIVALPACPTGDIRDYYRSIWQRMDTKAKSILHVLADLEFGPPSSAMYDCFGRSDESLSAFAAINHLLDYQETEVRPFHESLFAFVRDLPGHRETFCAHAPVVLDWLEMRAPEYLRWAWLWITKAQLGDPSDLLAGPKREWAISSLVAGSPIEQITTILDRAEKVAFDAFDLPRLLSLRSLKERTIYGPMLQTDQWSLFPEIAVSLSSEPFTETLWRAELHRAPTGMLPFIVRNATEAMRGDLADKTLAELNRRIARYDDETNDYERKSDLAYAIVAVFANASPMHAQTVVSYAKRVASATMPPTTYAQASGLNSNTDNVITYVKQFEDADALIATYSRESILASNFDNVFEVGKGWSGAQLDRDVLTAMCFEGLAPATKSELKALTHPAVSCYALLMSGSTKSVRTKRNLSHIFVGSDSSDERYAPDTRFVVYETFFAALAVGLSGGSAREWSEIPLDAQTTWLGGAVRALEQLAGKIAERWQTSRQWPSLQDIYDAFKYNPPTSNSFDAQRRFTAVRIALRDIAIDLCTIARGLDSDAFIDEDAIKFSSESPFWLDGLWLDAFTERRLKLHSPEAAQAFVERAGNYLDKTITDFNERTTTAIELAMFASDNGLVLLAQKELRRATGCLLGYGHHKDMFAFEVLRALELLTENGDVVAKKTILDLAGEFEAITAYTDGDETNHARENYYKAIAAHFPKRAPACYAHLIYKEEWRYAEALAIAIAESDQVESRTGLALLESYIVPAEVHALEEIGSASRPYTKTALAAAHRKIGKATGATIRNEVAGDIGYQHAIGTDPDSERAEVSVPHPREFPPGRLQEYLGVTRDVGTYYDRNELVTTWLRYWEADGRAEEALNDLEATTSETTPYRDLDTAFDMTFDVAFKIALESQGRSKAFPWLIHAHTARFGWQRWQTSDEEAQARMRAVAQHFRVQWKKFIKDTAKPVFPVGAARNGIYIGQSRLVYFLIEVGELDLARDYALEMARIFKAELQEQPISAPEWSK